ncbi:MAG TPA: efflux transporter outer membrane subunit [Candidatus Sulfotelmatobacter sp.]|nr:efflux transporter outer membrane subunit [Candidatus Sulfotelmatobacter sp.]
MLKTHKYISSHLRVCLFLSVLAFLIVMQSGCMVGPNYQRPKTSTPSQWISPLHNGETNATVDLAHWWRNFDDTNLDALMLIAIQSNLTLQVAEAHVREARFQRTVISGALWPSLGTEASYSRNRYSAYPPLKGFGIPLDYNAYDGNFDAAWELDVFGGTRRAIQVASAQIGAAEYGERDVLISVMAEVARDYISARAYQQRLDIAWENIQAEQNILSFTTNRFATGLGNELDVQQAKALLKNTQAQIPSLQTGFDQSVFELSVLLGQPPGTLMNDMSAEKEIPITPPAVPVGLPSDLLLRRPDVQQAERQLAAATAQIGVATANLFPQFSLTGVAGFQSIDAGQWLNWMSHYWTAGPTVQWEIFEAGSLVANVHAQNARQQAALAQYQQTVLVALQDVENALTAYAREQVRRESLEESVAADQRALLLATQLYKSGLVDFLHVLASESALYNEQDTLVQSDQTVSLDLVQLYKALGGGWEEEKELSLRTVDRK